MANSVHKLLITNASDQYNYNCITINVVFHSCSNICAYNIPEAVCAIVNPFSPNRTIKRASVCICVPNVLYGAVGFNDEIKVIYWYRGTKKVKQTITQPSWWPFSTACPKASNEMFGDSWNGQKPLLTPNKQHQSIKCQTEHYQKSRNTNYTILVTPTGFQHVTGKLTTQQFDKIVVTHSCVHVDRCIILMRYGTRPGFCRKQRCKLNHSQLA